MLDVQSHLSWSGSRVSREIQPDMGFMDIRHSSGWVEVLYWNGVITKTPHPSSVSLSECLQSGWHPTPQPPVRCLEKFHLKKTEWSKSKGKQILSFGNPPNDMAGLQLFAHMRPTTRQTLFIYTEPSSRSYHASILYITAAPATNYWKKSSTMKYRGQNWKKKN